jgi:hypothetical protein
MKSAKFCRQYHTMSQFDGPAAMQSSQGIRENGVKPANFGQYPVQHRRKHLEIDGLDGSYPTVDCTGTKQSNPEKNLAPRRLRQTFNLNLSITSS